jgi:hypothetical protein
MRFAARGSGEGLTPTGSKRNGFPSATVASHSLPNSQRYAHLLSSQLQIHVNEADNDSFGFQVAGGVGSGPGGSTLLVFREGR